MFPLVKGGVNTPSAKLACGALATPPLFVFLYKPSEFFSSREKLIHGIVFIFFSLIVIAPSICIAVIWIFKILNGEQVEEPNYIGRLINDLERAKVLRLQLNDVGKLKILAAHIKREIDKTSDMVSLLSQVLLIGGVLLGGILLSIGEKDANTQTAITASIGALLTFFARLYAIQRLYLLREWQSVVEQAQNVNIDQYISEQPQPDKPLEPTTT